MSINKKEHVSYLPKIEITTIKGDGNMVDIEKLKEEMKSWGYGIIEPLKLTSLMDVDWSAAVLSDKYIDIFKPIGILSNENMFNEKGIEALKILRSQKHK